MVSNGWIWMGVIAGMLAGSRWCAAQAPDGTMTGDRTRAPATMVSANVQAIATVLRGPVGPAIVDSLLADLRAFPRREGAALLDRRDHLVAITITADEARHGRPVRVAQVAYVGN